MNNKVDEYGNIYLFMTRKEMGENLKVSSKTVIKIFKELEKNIIIKVIEIIAILIGRVYMQIILNNSKKDLNLC